MKSALIFLLRCQNTIILESSVADPNPDLPDPHVFGPPGSGSISQRYGTGSGSYSGSGSVLLPENLHTYFELSVQAWILYKAPQWNPRYPNSCPERIKL